MNSTSTFSSFSCLRCGACCRWTGHVLLTHKDVTDLSAVLGMSEDAFVQRYTALAANRSQLTLVEQSDGACCFLVADNSCSVYDARPQQCRNFPHTWHVKGCPSMDSTLNSCHSETRVENTGMEKPGLCRMPDK